MTDDVEKGMLEGLVKGKKPTEAKPSIRDAKRAALDKKKRLQAKLEAEAAAAAAAVKEHTVVSGDTLSGIAQKYYGSQVNWKAIYEANKEAIGDNPSLIRAGQVLKIPNLD